VPDHWVRIGERGRGMGGATNLKVGGGGQCIRRWEVNTVKILKFEKGGGCMTPPQLLWWHCSWGGGEDLPSSSRAFSKELVISSL